ncbi:MAG: PAS domain S-box protein [Candidatus Competibacteraceae bacterium]|nr:PAS domain S-box protein [Candidatus Competibacteraceae bacterium]
MALSGQIAGKFHSSQECHEQPNQRNQLRRLRAGTDSPGRFDPVLWRLLVLTPELHVLQASANLGDFLHRSELLTFPAKLQDLIGNQQAARIDALYVDLPEGAHRSATIPIAHNEGSRVLRVVAHRMAAQYSLEIQFEEHATAPETSPIDTLPEALRAALEISESVFLNAKLATAKIAEYTGYARVMVYRFHSDSSGEVIAETRRPDLTPYLGLCYPATDIPAHARRLYALNRVRSIAAVDAAPVALQPPDHPVTGEPPDMTYSILRSAPPTHIEYLQNMGVAATLSSAIMVNGKLWGLIACHHTAPRTVDWGLREAFANATEVFGARLAQQGARDHALINAEGLERLVAKRTQALQLEIAERKRTQQALEQQRATLENTVRERTAHLTVLNRDLQAEIAAHQQSERALRDSEQRYRSLFEFANDGIFIIEAGRCVDCNPKIPHLFGCQREDIIGRSLLEFSPTVQPNGTRSQSLVTEKMGLTQAGEPQYFEWRYRRFDGTPFDAEISLTAVSEDNRSFIFALVRDITERKRSERARDRLLAELRRSNESLEQFAYIASHDLQEPLRKIRQFADRLLTNEQLKLADKIRDYLLRIHHSADYAQQLIRDLLAYSRVTRRAQPFKPVALNDVVTRALASLTTRVQEIGAQIETKPLPSVQGDRALLIELFHNVLDNALKFCRKGVTPQLRISAEALADDALIPSGDTAAYCRIVFEDNGIGFEPRYNERIFIIFQRLHDRQHYTGTGIGLAIAKKIVEYHGGHIEAHAVVDRGAVFRITLPLQARVHDSDSPITLPLQNAIYSDDSTDQ